MIKCPPIVVLFLVLVSVVLVSFPQIMVPKQLLSSGNGWNIVVNKESITATINEDASSTYLYFTYDHGVKTAKIVGTDAIPEFPSWTTLPRSLEQHWP